MFTRQRNSPPTCVVYPLIDPKTLCAYCPSVMPSDICFNCGKLSKFLGVFPELESSAEAHKAFIGPIVFSNINKERNKCRRDRKVAKRATNKPLVNSDSLDNRLHKIFELLANGTKPSHKLCRLGAEDTYGYHDVLRHKYQVDLSALDDHELSIHYLGHDLMNELNDPKHDQPMADPFQDADDEDSNYRYSEAEDSNDEHLGYQDPEAEDSEDEDDNPLHYPSMIEKFRNLRTIVWEPSHTVAQQTCSQKAFFKDLARWTFVTATSHTTSRAVLVEDEELSPFSHDRKFSFDDDDEFDRQFLDDMRRDW